MDAIHTRPANPEDDAHIVQIRNSIYHDQLPVSLEVLRHYRSVDPPEAGRASIVAEHEGEIVGYAEWSRRVHVVGENLFWCHINVDPRRRGIGIGRELYAVAIRRIEERGAKRLYAQSREDFPEALAFAERRGFKATGHGDRMSRLQVKAANLERGLSALQRLEADGIHIVTLSELGTDEPILRSLCALDNATSRDVPGAEEWKPISFEEWCSWVIDSPGQDLDALWVALHGDRIVGMTAIERWVGSVAENGYTGVDRAYRSRGIARALKARMAQWAAAQGIEYVITGNDVHNRPMLAVNMDMGYELLPANVEMVKEL